VEEVVVVDDGSMDGTSAEAKIAGALVLRLPRKCGKGYALNCGYLSTEAPYLAFVDADVGETAAELARLWEPVEAGIFDMAVGKLPSAGGGGFGLVKGLAFWGVRVLTGCRFEAALSGQRVLDRRIMQRLYPLAQGFGVEVDLTVRSVRAGFRVGEVPVAMTHRVTRQDLAGFSHRSRQFWEVGRVLLREALGPR
jgi:glycosyltransferase involved in cell wall biosynthesis